MWTVIGALFGAVVALFGMWFASRKAIKRMESMDSGTWAEQVRRQLTDDELKEIEKQSRSIADSFLDEMKKRGTDVYFKANGNKEKN